MSDNVIKELLLNSLRKDVKVSSESLFLVFEGSDPSVGGAGLSTIKRIIPRNIILFDKQENRGVKDTSDNTNNNKASNPAFVTENNFYPVFNGISLSTSSFQDDRTLGKNCKISCSLIGSIHNDDTNNDRCQFFFRFVTVDSGNVKKVLTNQNLSSSNKKVVSSILSLNFIDSIKYYSFSHSFEMFTKLSLILDKTVNVEVMKFSGNASWDASNSGTYGGDLLLNVANNNSDDQWNIVSTCLLSLEVLHSSKYDDTVEFPTYELTN